MGDEKQQEKERAVKAPQGGEDSIPDAGVFVPMAESLRLQGHYDEAIATLKGGLEKRPDVLPGRLLLGRCYLEKGMFSEAKEELEWVAKEIEECLSVYKMLSQVYLQEKDVDKALEVLRKILFFQTAEEAITRKVTPLEMGLLNRGSHPPFITSPVPSVPPSPFGVPPASPPATPPAPPPEPNQESRVGQEEEGGGQAPIQTDTLAEIYVRQGRLDRALAVYQEILGREPENTAARGKYEALRKRMEKDRQAEAGKKVQAKLEGWLAVLASREESTPS